MTDLFSRRPNPTHDFPLSRQLLINLLVVYGSVVALHWSELPIWIVGLCVWIVLWRINILKQKWQAPRLFLQIVLIILVSLGLSLEYSEWFAVEPMVMLLVVALSFKLLEIRYRRDYLLILFLSYFVIACSLLFNQSIMQSVLGLVAIALTTAALIQLYSLSSKPAASLRIASVMLVQSSVLMVVMLLVLPRINPLWAMPQQANSGVTGIGDSMSPGDISHLIRSNELALRITFDDEQRIEPSQMYWRGVVFDHFDGRRWQRTESTQKTLARNQWNSSNLSPTNRPLINQGVSQGLEKIQYEVIMEPSGQHWLFGVPTLYVDQVASTLRYTFQQEVLSLTPIHQRFKYDATSYIGGDGSTVQLSEYERQKFTSLPRNTNPQTALKAKELRSQSSTDQEYINKVLSLYRKSFTYTLSPPLLGEHSVDEFLFSSLKGFCEHFSSSFTVLMRNAGVPARVVVGYQGGTWSANDQYLSVYQKDAHAWAEVWLNGRGWIRVDPTAAVASVRVEQGVEAALSESDRKTLHQSRINYQWLTSVYNQWQLIDYQWQRWVLDYDSEKQQSILKQYFGDLTPLKMALLFMIPLLAVVLLLSVGMLRHLLIPASDEQKLYCFLQKKLHRLGVVEQPGETIASYCDRAAELYPNLKEKLSVVKQEFETYLYGKKHSFHHVKSVINQL